MGKHAAELRVPWRVRVCSRRVRAVKLHAAPNRALRGRESALTRRTSLELWLMANIEIQSRYSRYLYVITRDIMFDVDRLMYYGGPSAENRA